MATRKPTVAPAPKSAPKPAAKAGVPKATHVLKADAVAKPTTPPKAGASATRKRATQATKSHLAAVPRSAAPASKVGAGGTASRIKIFNIYYREDQRPQLDEAFIPYDNSGNTSHLLEFEVFRHLIESRQVKDADYWGALSWKFGQKSGLKGQTLINAIEANPGKDCIFVNPHPETESVYHNLWLQGDTAHPNFVTLAKAFFKAVGLDEKLIYAIYPSSHFASANYFVANQRFWKAYIDFVSKILHEADLHLPLPAKQAMYSSVADPTSIHADAGYWPFFVERLFSVFLVLHGKDFNLLKLPASKPALESNIHHKLLVQMKDAAWSSKNNWLAVCWVNYKTLYLSDLYGRDWIRVNVERITPPHIEFV